MWGENLLVAPVIKKGLTKRSIYLPEGKWFDFTTGTEYPGSSRIDFPLTIENLPVFAKVGSFIPMTKPVTSTDYYDGGNYVVRYYPSGQSTFTQYEDNGLDSKSLSEGKYELITYNGSKESQKTTISISKTGSWEGMPTTRSMKLEIRTGTKASKVIVNGKAVKIKAEQGKSTGKKITATFDEKWLYVNFNWDGNPMNIEIFDRE